ACRRMASEAGHPPSLAERPLCRHSPEVGAVCGKAARTVLCGGRRMKPVSLPLRRRGLLALAVGVATLRSLAAVAQQKAPVIGWLHSLSADRATAVIAAFREGLREVGYIDGQNVAIEYRWADGQYDRLAGLAADLVARKVN